MTRHFTAIAAALSLAAVPVAAQAGAPVRPGAATVKTVPAGIRAGVERPADASNATAPFGLTVVQALLLAGFTGTALAAAIHIFKRTGELPPGVTPQP